mmetsp:Transcript_4045/g.3378  ORF Transcript_4045/g.3378 Transcript_4045/m.3378 type:complete len:125 (-) Transcript_4045:273-647(-)
MVSVYFLAHFIIASYSFKTFQSLYLILFMTVPFLIIYGFNNLYIIISKNPPVVESDGHRSEEENKAPFTRMTARERRNNRIYVLPSRRSNRNDLNQQQTEMLLQNVFKKWRRTESLAKNSSTKS